MHPALRLDEVITIIVRQGLADADLAALAQVSRLFSTHALDVLWHELDSMVPLLRCLPSGLVHRQAVGGQMANAVTVTYSLSRPFAAADWDIFLKYARRVVYLGGASPDPVLITANIEGQTTRTNLLEIVDQSVFEALCTAPSPRPLLPKMRELVWADSTAQDAVWFLRFLLGPSVTQLEFQTTSLDVPVLSLVSIIPTLCPFMECFSWYNKAELSSYAIRVSSDVACAWSNLRELTCPALNSQALHRLSSFPSLEELYTILADPFPYNIQLNLDCPPFPALDRLSLGSVPHQSLTQLSSFMKTMTIYPPFVQLNADGTSESAVMEVLDVLSSDFRGEDFEILFIIEFDKDPVAGEHPLLTIPMLRPVFRIGSLTGLTIDTDRSVLLNDADILELVDGMPGLCALSINERSGWRTRPFAAPLVTMHGLRRIVDRLEWLLKLSIAIDTEHAMLGEADLTAATSAVVTSSKPARIVARGFSLNLLDSRVGSNNTPIVAALLSDMFVSLKQFEVWNFERLRNLDNERDVREAREQVSRWSQVQSLMRVMQEVRRHEKARWTNDPKLS